MPFEQKTVTWFQIVCDMCDTAAPRSQVASEARQAATERGWHLTTKHNGVQYIHTYLCPVCISEDHRPCRKGTQ